VNSGSWYFETRCVSGIAVVGWALSSFKKNLTSGGTGDVFFIDLNKGQVVGGASRLRASRYQVNTGDIIGSLIDFSNRSVSFSINGEFRSDLTIRGVTFSPREGYCPAVELRAGCAACVSISGSSFIAGLPPGASAYGNVSQSEAVKPVGPMADELSKIFDKFVTEANPNKCNEDELLELFKAVGEESDSDPIAFVFLWYVNKKTHDWEVTRDNFVTTFAEARCQNLGDIKKLLRKEVNSLLTHRGDSWASFYKFVFYLLPETGSHMVNAEKAAGVWEVLGFKSWSFFSKWSEFIIEQQQQKEEEIKRDEEESGGPKPGSKRTDPALIGLDVWQSFPSFVSEYPKSFDAYDLDDLCYNTLFGDFVQKVRGH